MKQNIQNIQNIQNMQNMQNIHDQTSLPRLHYDEHQAWIDIVFENPEVFEWLLPQPQQYQHHDTSVQNAFLPSLSQHSALQVIGGDVLISTDQHQVCTFFQGQQPTPTIQPPQANVDNLLHSLLGDEAANMSLLALSPGYMLPTLHVTPSSNRVMYQCNKITTNNKACLMTLVDTKVPFAISECIPTLQGTTHHAMCKVEDEDIILACVYSLEDNSSMLCITSYPLDNRLLPKTYIMHFIHNITTENKYPQSQDIRYCIEVEQMRDCPYCLLRGDVDCECTPMTLARLRRKVCGLRSQNPWEAWRSIFNACESQPKKHRVVVHLVTDNIQSEPMECFSITRPWSSSAEWDLGIHTTPKGARLVIPTHLGLESSEVLEHDSLLLIEDTHEDVDMVIGATPSTLADPQGILPHLGSTEFSSSSTVAVAAVSAAAAAVAAAAAAAAGGLSSSPNESGGHAGSSVASPGRGKSKRSRKPRQSLDPEIVLQQREEALRFFDEVFRMPWKTGDVVACRLCGMEYVKKFDLKRHLKGIHLMDRDFACGFCNKKFKRKEHLDTHMTHVHNKQEFPCSHCDVVLASEGNLRRHIRTAHQDVEMSKSSSEE
eukprot:CAMPEP_0184693172 /NCGR_PEP_ID=MMETSP0313-20130426/1450_1 /TAXON_ID=2792 /ORGANISM="Porphyridium aerugineum, Strain SAG 1380-2" /LENGTH=600 /DNA_ID=CAMNT_0027151169 /DNA_START=417 /DNA_END=2219 /DNA_ORIENTATION=+